MFRVLHSLNSSEGRSAPLDPSDRPSPEDFLDWIEKSKRGRLKVYIGHAAGTGKTVQMLEEGNELLKRKHEVIGGYIETHGRQGTENAIRHLPILPRRNVEYKGKTFEEMDIDAILARKPEIVIIDELPHTNIALGSRHEKRWQDIEEILDAGISVITAMNVQHLESLNPVVEKVTGVKVRETVPDSFLHNADQIVNVDISSSDLRERLRRGEIYAPEKIESALSNFFTPENLSNLRELGLREVVRYLDQGRKVPQHSLEAEEDIEIRERPPTNGSGEQALLSPLAEADIDPVVMVAISSRPPDVRGLLRKAAAIAHRLNTHWYLVYVETPREDTDSIDATTQRILMNNILLAKDLGATVVRLKGKDVAVALADFAREYGITHAIFGGGGLPRSFWDQLQQLVRGGDIITRFHRLASKVDLHVCGI